MPGTAFTPSLKVAFLGLGVMGYPMARHLAQAGHAVCVYNRTTAKATWTVVEPAAGTSVCYDFAAATEVAGCTGTAWDVKITGTQRGGRRR